MTLDSHHRPQNETAPAANRGGNRDGRIDAIDASPDYRARQRRCLATTGACWLRIEGRNGPIFTEGWGGV